MATSATTVPIYAVWRRILVLGLVTFVSSSPRAVTRAIDKSGSQLNLGSIVGDNKIERESEGDSAIPFNLEETYGQKFLPLHFNGTWRSDTEIVYTDGVTGNIVKLNVETLRKTVLFDAAVLQNYQRIKYTLSSDETFLLIGHEASSGFRHSIFRKYVVFDSTRKRYEEIADGEFLTYAQWVPGKNELVYVLENNIYHRSFENDKLAIRKLTKNGVTGLVYNGVPDWVYEEEVLRSASAIWFSPDGTHLVYATFNDTNVKDATYFYYGDPGSLDYQYPREVKIKYPKAGSPNPVVTLSSIDLTDLNSTPINLEAPKEVVGDECIIYTVTWLGKNIVATWTNRIQNVSQMAFYNRETGYRRNVLKLEESEGWLEVPVPVYYEGYLILQKMQPSGTPAGRFMHLTRYQYENGVLSKETDLTPGAFEVYSFLGVDYSSGIAYYLANSVEEPSQKNFYSVPVRGVIPERPTCVSCKLLTPEGNNCTYVAVSFSLLKSYYALTCDGPDPATVSIFNGATQRRIQLWEGNEQLRRRLAERVQPIVKNLYVKANGYESKVKLLLPPEFDERKSYPMLVNVYAGPNTVRITDAASYGFHSYMTTNRSAIYAWIDGRGSGHRGSKLLFEIYRRIGTVEVEDQISVVRSLQDMYSWIDANRTGIWGWSYGGFATAMTLATDTENIFKCGISVAPVAAWIYYDSIYTERCMGLPTEEDNLRGYNRTDVTRLVEGIRGKKFMLIHGTGDDNVHYQQAMALAKALEVADIPFEQVTYTDEAHGLTGVSPHLYHTMDKFWTDCLFLSHAH